METDFHGVEESTEVGIILHEFFSSLGKNEGNSFDVHSERDVVIG